MQSTARQGWALKDGSWTHGGSWPWRHHTTPIRIAKMTMPMASAQALHMVFTPNAIAHQGELLHHQRNAPMWGDFLTGELIIDQGEKGFPIGHIILHWANT